MGLGLSYCLLMCFFGPSKDAKAARKPNKRKLAKDGDEAAEKEAETPATPNNKKAKAEKEKKEPGKPKAKAKAKQEASAKDAEAAARTIVCRSKGLRRRSRDCKGL